MLDQGHYSDYTTSSLFASNNTIEICSTEITKPGAAAEEENRSVVERVIWSILLIIIILASIIGNMLVLVCVHLHRGLREENSIMFIVNLSVVDMISAAVVMISSSHALASDQWLMGPTWCNIVCGTNYTLIIVSMFTLCFVALDRYIAVKHALHYHARVTRQKIYLMLGFAWCLGFCFGLVPILYHWIRFDYWEAVCAIEWHADRQHVLLFVTVGFGLCFVLPSVVLIIAYSKVMKIALAHNKVHQYNAEIQASAVNRQGVADRFVPQITTDSHRINQHISDNSTPQNGHMVTTKDEQKNISCLPPKSSENEENQFNIIQRTDTHTTNENGENQFNIITQRTDPYTTTANPSSNAQLNETLKYSDGTVTCEIEADHQLVTSSTESDVTPSMQPMEEENKYNSSQPLHHHSSPVSHANGKPATQTTHIKSVLFKLPENFNENNASCDQEKLPNQTDECLQKTVSNKHSSLGSRQNYGASKTIEQRSDDSSFSSRSQHKSSNEVCNNMTDTSLPTATFIDQTIQHNVFMAPSEQSQLHATVDQATHIAESQRQLKNNRPDAETSTSVNMSRRPDRLESDPTDNNYNIIDTRRPSRSVINTNNSTANKKKYAASNKAVKSLLLVVIAYFIFMTPFCVTKLCKVVFVDNVLPDYINLVASIFQYCSSAVNPLIYGIFRKDFQRAFGLLANRFLGKYGTKNVNTSDAQSTVY